MSTVSIRDKLLISMVKGMQNDKYLKMHGISDLWGVRVDHVCMVYSYYMLLMHNEYASGFEIREEDFNKVYKECEEHLKSIFFIQEYRRHNNKGNVKGTLHVIDANIASVRLGKEKVESYLIRAIKFCINFHIFLGMPVNYRQLCKQSYWYEWLISNAYLQNVLKAIPVQFSVKEECEDIYYKQSKCLLEKEPDDIGMDVYAAEAVEIEPFECKLVRTGLIVRTPRPFTPSLYSRSSLFVKKRLLLANSRGIIDYGYCGSDDEIKMALLNVSNEIVRVERGEKLTQIVIEPVISDVKWYRYNVIKDESRGGFGHSGGYKM